MVSIDEGGRVDEGLIEESLAFSPSPAEFLDENRTVHYTIRTEKRGLDVDGSKWNRHEEVYSIVTDSFLLVIGDAEPSADFIKVPYSAVSAVEWKSVPLRRFNKIVFTADRRNHTVFAPSSLGSDALDRIVELFGRESDGRDVEEGRIDELYAEKQGVSLTEEVYLRTYHADRAEINHVPRKEQRIALAGDTITFEGFDSRINLGDVVETFDFIHKKTYDFKHRQTKTYFETGIELVLRNGAHIAISRRREVAKHERSDYDAESEMYPDPPAELISVIESHVDDATAPAHTVIRPFTGSGTLRVEGWKEGASTIDAGLEARSTSTGK